MTVSNAFLTAKALRAWAEIQRPDSGSWEEVPHDGEAAHNRGYGLGDCPYPHGTPDGALWRKSWIAAEGWVQDIHGNSRRAAAAVPSGQLPAARTWVDALIEEMAHVNDPAPEPKPEWTDAPSLSAKLFISDEETTRSFKGLLQGFSIAWGLDEVARLRDEDKAPALDVPVARHARFKRVIWRRDVDGPKGISAGDPIRQMIIEEEAKLALRRRDNLPLHRYLTP